MKTYIHYGHREFEPELFRDIRNRQSMSKPSGGLWASDISATYGWKDWCNAEHFRNCDDKNAFCFVLNENAKILTIKSVKDLEKLPKVEDDFRKFSSWVCLDFEKLAKKYDAIEVIISASNQYSLDNSHYFSLYGWDCDSILIMNKDIIRII